jgi:hypothetical protein
MQRYTILSELPPVATDRGEFYLAADVDEVLRRQASAAIAGMNAAQAISSGQLQQAHRLRAESSPESLASERQANAILTDRIAELEQQLAMANDAAAKGEKARLEAAGMQE